MKKMVHHLKVILDEWYHKVLWYFGTDVCILLVLWIAFIVWGIYQKSLVIYQFNVQKGLTK